MNFFSNIGLKAMIVKWRPFLAILLGLFWLLAIKNGFSIMLDYAYSAGPEKNALAIWPATSSIQLDGIHPTLIIFAHPHCPCTRATIGELALIMASCKDKITAEVLFFKPTGFSETWTKTDIVKSASAIPGVRIGFDEDGLEAERFHAKTSGYTLLYNKEGTLLFSGGITASRGHSGDNTGRAAILALANNRTIDRNQTPVFGCSIGNLQSSCNGTISCNK